MKIRTLVTFVHRDKAGKKITSPPDTILDIDDAEAKDLIERGKAKAAGKADKEAASESADGEPKVVKSDDSGPKVVKAS